MIVNLLLVVILTMSTGSEFEVNGDFAEAGLAYRTDSDAQGQVRILSRFLEEALYAGRPAQAYNLIMFLELYPIPSCYFDFWYARLSWSCGLSESACRSLDSIDADPWLSARSRGLSSQFRGDAEKAADYFRESWYLATTSREKFYSALDLSFALIQTEQNHESQMISSYLAEHFPGEGLPLIAFALSMYARERFGEAMTILQSVSSGDFTGNTRHFASSILEDLE